MSDEQLYREVFEGLKKLGLPITRENFIRYIYITEENLPDFWDPSMEMELPEHLQKHPSPGLDFLKRKKR